MGNCGTSRHAVESWADDGEWEEEEEDGGDGRHHQQHQHERREEHASEEVTIRITRRQLHELVEKKQQLAAHHGVGLPFVGRNQRRSTTEQLLADIMNSGEVHVHHHAEEHLHWKPALQSIPEAAVELS